MLSLTFLFYRVLKAVANVIRKVRCIKIGKEEAKLSLFADDTFIYIGNPITIPQLIEIRLPDKRYTSEIHIPTPIISNKKV